MKQSRRDVMLAAGAVAASCGFPATAVAKAETGELADLIARRIRDQKRGTGAAAGFVHDGRLSVTSYGAAGLRRRTRPDGHSVFQIASLTKIFTALLLADAVQRGEVALDDPLARHFAVAPPAFEGRAITLRDLATHTSGLPLRPASRADRDQNDPYAGYADADLHNDVLAIRLERAPGAAFAYSNFDYGLLGDALCHRLGRSYGELLASRILGPLGMTDTRLKPPAPDARRRVDGYDPAFQPMRPWDFGALAPAGGLFSTIDDLAKFVALWIGDGRGALAVAAKTMLAVDRPGDDADTRMALGWRVTTHDGVRVVWSNGSGGGVRSFMGFNPASATGVIAFANMASARGVDDIGMHVLDPALPVDVSVTPARVAVTVPGAVLDRYVGTYTYAPDDSITIVRAGAGIAFVQGPNRAPLLAAAPALFFFPDDNVTIAFETLAGGPSPALVLTQGGQAYRYPRTP